METNPASGNFIVTTHYTTQWKILVKSAKRLKMYIPRGCPFKNYTLFDLLEDKYVFMDFRQRAKIFNFRFCKANTQQGRKSRYIWRYGHKVIGNVVNFYNSQRRETAQCLVYYIFA